MNGCSQLNIFDHVFIGYRFQSAFMTATDVSVVDCAKRCFSYLRCKSFNFKYADNVCELSITSHSTEPSRLVQEVGSYYSEIHLWPKEVRMFCLFVFVFFIFCSFFFLFFRFFLSRSVFFFRFFSFFLSFFLSVGLIYHNYFASRKHTYMILTPLNPTFI